MDNNTENQLSVVQLDQSDNIDRLNQIYSTIGKISLAPFGHGHSHGSGSQVDKNPTETEIKSQKSFLEKIRHINPAFFGLALVFVSCLVMGSLMYFETHALPNTYLADTNVSLWSKEKIANYTKDKANEFRIVIVDKDKKEDLNLNDLGISLDHKESANQIFNKQSDSPINKLTFWKKNNYLFLSSLDEDKINNYIQAKKIVKQAGQNAALTIDNGQITIQSEINQIDVSLNDPINRVKESASKATPLSLAIEEVSTTPKITSKQLEPLKGYVEQIIKTNITLKLNDKTIYTTSNQRASWITISPESTNEGSIQFDPIKINSFIEGVITPYVKPPRPRVIYEQPDGSIKELVQGEDGINIQGKEDVVNNIKNALDTKKDTIINVPVSYSERSTIKAGNYDKWLQIDLTNKRLYAYAGGELVNEFLVSAGAPATPTVVGEYKIKSKIRVQTMRGLNADGSKYIQPNVEYVNYFYQDYAIHGNYWRPDSVFGNVNTSHGCVGLRNNDAKWVYDWAGIGTTVITHY